MSYTDKNKFLFFFRSSGIACLILLLNVIFAFGQKETSNADSAKVKGLDSILIISILKKGTVQALPSDLVYGR